MEIWDRIFGRSMKKDMEKEDMTKKRVKFDSNGDKKIVRDAYSFVLKFPLATTFLPKESKTITFNTTCESPVFVFESSVVKAKGLKIVSGAGAYDTREHVKLEVVNTKNEQLLFEVGDMIAKIFVIDVTDFIEV